MRKLIYTCWRVFFLAAAALSGRGRRHDDPDNMSSMPWNTPKSWEGPMPSTFNQGR